MFEPVPAKIRKQLLPAGIPCGTPIRHPTGFVGRRTIACWWPARIRLKTPPRNRPAVLVQRTGQLMYELLTMYPAISGLRPEWGGIRLTVKRRTAFRTSGPIATTRATCSRSVERAIRSPARFSPPVSRARLAGTAERGRPGLRVGRDERRTGRSARNRSAPGRHRNWRRRTIAKHAGSAGTSGCAISRPAKWAAMEPSTSGWPKRKPHAPCSARRGA